MDRCTSCLRFYGQVSSWGVLASNRWSYDIKWHFNAFFFQGSNDPIYDCLAMKLFIEVELNQTSYWDPNYDDSITDVQGRFLDGVVAWFREMGQFATTILWHLEILEVSWPMDLRSPIRRRKMFLTDIFFASWAKFRCVFVISFDSVCYCHFFFLRFIPSLKLKLIHATMTIPGAFITGTSWIFFVQTYFCKHVVVFSRYI